MTTDEKISHIVSRLIRYEQTHCDGFKDVAELDNIEYSCLFFEILTYSIHKNMTVGKRIIQTNMNIGVKFLKAIRNKSSEDRYWVDNYTNGYFKEHLENNEDLKLYVGNK